MDRMERFYRVHHLLKAGKCLSMATLLSDLEVSRATMKRDLEYMRDRLNAPLIYDRDREGYRYDLEMAGAERYDLPGVWFSPAEIHALFVIHGLLRDIGPGLLDGTVSPLIARIEHLLESSRLPAKELGKRIRLLNVAHRASLPAHFGLAAQAVLQRQQLQLTHRHRGEHRSVERTLSPQRLVLYRGTWYLDAWCHLREALRSFSVDAIEQIRILDNSAKDVPETRLDDFYSSSYGIFNGASQQIAILRFSADRARWVRHEMWHPQQEGTLEADGRYRLQFPYGNVTELVMDILRHGSHVEVVAPPMLRDKVAAEVESLWLQYKATAPLRTES